MVNDFIIKCRYNIEIKETRITENEISKYIFHNPKYLQKHFRGKYGG